MSFRKKLNVRTLAGASGLLLALSLFLVPASVLAVPQGGHVFFGTVTTEGAAAAEGTVITASVAGLEYTTTVDAEGTYGYDTVFKLLADDPDTPEAEGAEAGDLIVFQVGGIEADLYDVDAEESLDSYPFEISGATKLNLAVGVPPTEYTLTVASSAGGSVSQPAEAISAYDPATAVDLLAVPDEGYEFVNWTGDDVGTVADVSAASTTITMNGDYSITANFAEIGATYDLFVSSSDGGSVTQPGEGGPFNYPAGTVVNLLAVPDEGYEFVNWTGDAAGVNDAATTITMNDDEVVHANFAEEEDFDPYIYDEDEDDVIDKDEALDAVDDYDTGTISKADALEVVILYFS